MALGPALLDLAACQPEHSDSDTGASLADLAATALGDLTGVPAPDELRAPDTAMSRASVEQFFREQLRRFDARLRYLGPPPNRFAQVAEPVTLALLAANLSDVANPERAATASYQLRAMTGEDHGFVSDQDIIANLDAIAAWAERAAQPLAVEPGGWAFAGHAMPPPEVP
jgi:hypothetical protein